MSAVVLSSQYGRVRDFFFCLGAIKTRPPERRESVHMDTVPNEDGGLQYLGAFGWITAERTALGSASRNVLVSPVVLNKTLQQLFPRAGETLIYTIYWRWRMRTRTVIRKENHRGFGVGRSTVISVRPREGFFFCLGAIKTRPPPERKESRQKNGN